MGKKVQSFITSIPGSLVSLGIIISCLVYIGWSAYADPIIDFKIKNKIDPINSKLNYISYLVNKIILIQTRTTDPKILEQVEKDLENFKPKN